MTDKYGSSIKQSIKTLSKDEIDFLISLPENHSLIIDKLSFFICHGSTESPFDYVYPDADKKTIYKKLISDAEVTIFGNTHYQTIFNYNHKILINLDVGQQGIIKLVLIGQFLTLIPKLQNIELKI